MMTEPVKHDHFKDAGKASFQVAISMFLPAAAWVIPALEFLNGEKRRKPSEDWQSAVHNALQELDRRVSQLEGGGTHQDKVQGLSHLVAVFLVKELDEFLHSNLNRDALLAAFSDNDSDEIDEAVMELEIDGYANISHAIGHRYLYVRPSHQLIFTYDPLLHGWLPAADAVALYRFMDANQNYHSMMLLKPVIEWNLRRFNAAQLYLREEIFYDGLYSKTNHQELVVPSFSPQPKQKVLINRLEKDLVSKGISIPPLTITQ
jgi:hypothetical protein